jgi:hypothetical protein
MACCISFSSFSNLSYIFFYFAPYLCKRYSDTSSIAPRTRLISSFLSVASSWGLLVQVFFISEGFCGETFLFFVVIVSVGGSFSNVASPSPCFSPSSPPPSPFTSYPPPSESDPYSFEAFHSSSVSIL